MIFNMGRAPLARKPVERLFPIPDQNGLGRLPDDYKCQTCGYVWSSEQMWTATECADCHASKIENEPLESEGWRLIFGNKQSWQRDGYDERVCVQCDGDWRYESHRMLCAGQQLLAKSWILLKAKIRSNDGADCHAKKGTPQHVTPLEADPTSAGWVLDPFNECWSKFWIKGDCELARQGREWFAWKNHFGLTSDGVSNSHSSDPFKCWREIDALLFPKAREFRVGDTVECLPDEEFIVELGAGETPARRAQVGKTGIIRAFETCGLERQFNAVTWENSLRWMWPVRALRLIRAVDA